MDLRVSTTNQATPQTRELAKQLRVVLPAGTELVFFGPNAPLDTGLRWQQTDAFGAHVGQIKTFIQNKWV